MIGIDSIGIDTIADGAINDLYTINNDSLMNLQIIHIIKFGFQVIQTGIMIRSTLYAANKILNATLLNNVDLM
jgi:hypothetical protein